MVAHGLPAHWLMPQAPQAATAPPPPATTLGDAIWTCPFCPLLCDGAPPQVKASGAWQLPPDADCPRAEAALHAASHWQAATPMRAGQVCDLNTALASAARLLGASRLPLVGGLGTDVAGARALYRLACAAGAVCDAAAGDALMRGVRALQDRGGFSTTLAELHSRADLVLCFGGLPTARQPRFLARAGLAATDPRLLVLGQGMEASDPSDAFDPFDAAATLAKLVAGRAAPQATPALVMAAKRLKAARYAVLVYEPAQLPAHGELVIEMLQRVVSQLNTQGRAAALALGGGEGASTVNQVFTWLSGLPLRSRLAPAGLVHEPVLLAAPRLLADQAVDLLLWVASFGTEAEMPATQLPRIVLGHPGLAEGVGATADVFIPVATPGWDSGGHLFRTDGVVLMPLHPLCASALPSVAQVLGQLLERLPAALLPPTAAAQGAA